MPFPQRVIPTRTDIEDVYQENTQNILQKTAVSNMIGVLEQLNKISVFASEIFSDILESTETNNARIKKIKTRIRTIDAKIPSTEQLFLDNSPSYFYDNPYPGKEWQRKDPLRGLLFRRDRASKPVNQRRSVGLPLPDLSSLDRISASGPCIKKYSDSNFFMNEWLEAEKKKMEEEKAKRRERKKKRKKRKRQQKEKITGIERWVYDPITGKKVKKKAAEIAVTKYELTDNNAGAVDFESADKSTRDRMDKGNASKGKAKSNQKSKAKVSKQKQVRQQPPPTSSIQPGGGGAPPPNPVQNGGPPPVPGQNAAPPPNPVQNGGPPPVPVNPGGGPPPVPVPGQNRGGPPPVPVVMKKSAEQMARESAMHADNSGAYAARAKKEPVRPQSSNAMLMSGIRGGIKLKKAAPVKRVVKMEKRDVLLNALRKKGQTGLRKVREEEKNVKKEEKIDNTIFAILNRRQFMADSDSDSGSDWSTDSDM